MERFTHIILNEVERGTENEQNIERRISEFEAIKQTDPSSIDEVTEQVYQSNLEALNTLQNRRQS